MIKAEDLPLGNIVKMPSSGELTRITAMDISDIQSNLKNRLPVDLSEEILLKVGFVEDEPYLELEISPGYGIQYYQYKTDKNKISIYSGTTVISNHCKYLHQLQNLYFSLTGGDLDTSRLL